MAKKIKLIRLGISSDHAGYALKKSVYEYLLLGGYAVKDFGAFGEESVDYPEYALKVVSGIIDNELDYGILFCGTGIGVSISANKFPGIRAALCHDTQTAKLSKMHNNANIIAIGSRILNETVVKEMIIVWLNTQFEGGRHNRRISIIDKQALSYWKIYIKEMECV